MTCALCRAGRHTLCDTFRRTRIDPGGLAELIRVPAENARLDVLALPDRRSATSDATLIEPLGCVLRGQRWAGVGPGLPGRGGGRRRDGAAGDRAPRAPPGGRAVVAVEPREDRRALAVRAGAPRPRRRRSRGRWRAGARRPGRPGLRLHQPRPTRSPAPSTWPVRPAWCSCSRRRAPGTPVALDLGAVFFREVTIQSTYSAGPLDTRDALALLAAGAIADGAT